MPLFMKLAGQIGLDRARFKRDLETHAHQARIKAEQALAVSLGARGTPAFFINGVYVRGARPLANLKQTIEEQIAKARTLMRTRRLPLAKVYDSMISGGATAPVYLK